MKRLIITIPEDTMDDAKNLNPVIEAIDERFTYGLPIYIPEPLKYEIVDIDEVKMK